jgi:hypothetical protein
VQAVEELRQAVKKDAKDVRVTFGGREFTLSVHRYAHAEHFALRLSDARTGEHAHWASMVFAPEAKLTPNQVLVQEAGETSGMLRALEAAGVVRATGRLGRWHGHDLPVAELLIETPALRMGMERQREPTGLGAWLNEEYRDFREVRKGGKKKDASLER